MKANLLKKSKQNFKSAEIAQKEKFYDVAISRYYYSIYQKIIYILDMRGIDSTPKNGANSHNETIEKFNETVFKELSFDESKRLQILKVKQARVKADYDKELYTKEDFNVILTHINNIDKILDSLYKKGEPNE
ncbi:MAG: hypothetical protein ATN35_01900 [Epulopiscium sp. Nele67-Bin004]|nr:MAG: hypothetical protein ATN35_01900 [Epulopiscium sp. Nele67-Bin004]